MLERRKPQITNFFSKYRAKRMDDQIDLSLPYILCRNNSECIQSFMRDVAAWNDYENSSLPPPEDGTTSTESFITALNTIGTPLIIFPGIVGNLISLIVFLWTHLKVQSSSIYLAFLNIADTGFLLSLIPPWTGFSINASWFNRNGWCQVTMFTTYTFGFLSVWAIVFISLERYIVVFYPWLRHKLCSRKSTLYVIGTVTILTCLFNSYLFWTLKSISITDTNVSMPLCLLKDGYANEFTLRTMTIAETLLRYIVPCILVVCLNGRISFHIAKTMKLDNAESAKPNVSSSFHGQNQSNNDVACRTHSLKNTVEARSCNLDVGISNNFHCESCNYVPSHTADIYSMEHRRGSSASTKRNPRIGVVAAHYKQSRERRRRYQLQATRSLVIISSVFVILNFPFFSFRVYYNLRSTSSLHLNTVSMSVTSVAEQICFFLHYVNFSVNFIMYVLFSRHFRRGLWRLFGRIRKNVCKQCTSSPRKPAGNDDAQRERHITVKKNKFIFKIRGGSLQVKSKNQNIGIK